MMYLLINANQIEQIFFDRAQSTAVQSATMNAIVPPTIAIVTSHLALAAAVVAAVVEEAEAVVAH